jgi:hypothetical protein
MGKGEELHASNNATSNGPIVGMAGSGTLESPPMSARTSYIDEAAAGKVTDKSLITADLWQNLAKRASKLMYHPYQCNICNVYEGGEFPEVVRELGTVIQEKKIGYSWV